jgi:hypothetical protein
MLVLMLMEVRRPDGGHGWFCCTIPESLQRELGGILEELTVKDAIAVVEGVIDLLGEAVEGGGGDAPQPCGYVHDHNRIRLRLHLLQLGLERVRMDDAGQPRLGVPEMICALFQRTGRILDQPTRDGLMRVIQLDDAGSRLGVDHEFFTHSFRG